MALLPGTADPELGPCPSSRQQKPCQVPATKGFFSGGAQPQPPGEGLRRPPRPGAGCAIINVGGSRYQVPWSGLESCPLRRLGRLSSCRSREELLQVCDDFDASRDEFFFDRSPGAFRCIVALLRARKLRLLRGTCALSFQEELRYWGVGLQHLERCCRQRLRQRQEEAAETGPGGGQEAAGQDSVPAPRGSGRLAPCMGRLRDMVENPHSGLPGKVFACISISFVAITAVSLCISTMPEVREEEEQGECSGRCQALLVLEAVCVGWFSLELLLRWLQARDRCAFLRAPLTLIDGLALLPFYVSLLLRLLSDAPGGGASSAAGGRLAERAGLALRLLRVLSMARHSLGLRSLGLTARRCARHCGLLLLFLGLAVALFSPLVHLAESELGARQEFRSVPGTYWWAVISMTTVGYGDMVPRSVPGQVAALSGILSGILLMAFPVTSIFHTFSRSYSELREQQRRAAGRRPCLLGDGAKVPAGATARGRGATLPLDAAGQEGQPEAGRDAKGSADSEEMETTRSSRQGAGSPARTP